MGVRQVTLVIAAMCVLIGIAYYGYLSGRFELLYRDSDFAVEVNGRTVDADLLVGRASPY